MSNNSDGQHMLKIENEAQMRFKKESMACADRIEYVLESLYKDY
jgi:hypothetical protein